MNGLRKYCQTPPKSHLLSFDRFLGLYGLVFPAYALLFMRERHALAPTPITVTLFLILLVPCGIAFDLAFVDLSTAWVLPAVGGLLGLAAALWLVNRGTFSG